MRNRAHAVWSAVTVTFDEVFASYHVIEDKAALGPDYALKAWMSLIDRGVFKVTKVRFLMSFSLPENVITKGDASTVRCSTDMHRDGSDVTPARIKHKHNNEQDEDGDEITILFDNRKITCNIQFVLTRYDTSRQNKTSLAKGLLIRVTSGRIIDSSILLIHYQLLPDQ